MLTSRRPIMLTSQTFWGITIGAIVFFGLPLVLNIAL